MGMENVIYNGCVANMLNSWCSQHSQVYSHRKEMGLLTSQMVCEKSSLCPFWELAPNLKKEPRAYTLQHVGCQVQFDS